MDDGGQSPTSLDSEQIEHAMPNGINAKLCERGANSRQIVFSFNFLCVNLSLVLKLPLWAVFDFAYGFILENILTDLKRRRNYPILDHKFL